MSDNNPKALIFGGEEHNAPLADISHLSDVQKARLKSKALGEFGTYDYEKFKSDEEFELALACLAPYYWGNHKVTDEDMAEYAAYHRSFYYHKKKYRVWKKEVLDPMVKTLADYALNAPQYDASAMKETLAAANPILIVDGSENQDEATLICHKLKNDTDGKILGLIMLTTSSHESLRDKQYRNDVDCFLAKPFDMSVLLNICRKIASQYSTNSSTNQR